ncbi:patatin-domain-containing protein [Phaffia rhodozyma]|uniref:Patatin-like phospholipase domain-containing protein n=1 Tax=Phaffia rhodozyma TaxID=264483 RepID=A0A0F7SNR2_PHARH|nr:patatin-domain-containing protein [Phaffia rhodozyma]
MPASLSEELFTQQFVDESHIRAFAKALSAPDLATESSSVLTDKEPGEDPARSGNDLLDLDLAAKSGGGMLNGNGANGHEGVEKLKSVSDFAPINTRIRKRSKKKTSGAKAGFSYRVARYPLLFLILGMIFFEFGFYVATRQIVNVFEFFIGLFGQKRNLRHKLRYAKTFEEWKEAALEMDEFLGFNAWKMEDEDAQYDWSLVRKVKRSLATLRAQNDVRGLVGVLDVCLRPSFAGIERVRLYSEAFYGTKHIIESYIDEVSLALKFVRESEELGVEEKKRFFKSCNKNFGSSALCLSGGASFGYYHIGVVRAFLDADLLPRVITGTSAGALIAALVTTRTDDELKVLLTPQLADRITACEDSIRVWLKRFWKTGARFDTVTWAEKASFFTHGSLTFREAYERTGRVLNVSVIPHDRHSPTKLLNYLTSPDCVIWSAIIASAAVPGILNPVVLMKKDMETGKIMPWNWGTRFKDGSLRVDIPLQSLHLLFNVNHSIVSQVNPHVHLFFFAPQGTAGRPVAHRKGKGWRGGFLLSAMEQYLKLELNKNFKVIRDLELMPTMLGQDWSSVFLQKFEGSITIWPKTRAWDWLRLLTDPDRQELERMINVGQACAWPKLHMISNRDKIEREILRGRQFVRTVLANPSRRDRISDDGDSKHASPSRPARRQDSIPVDSDAESGYNRASTQNSPSRTRYRSEVSLGLGSREDGSRIHRKRNATSNSSRSASLGRLENPSSATVVAREDIMEDYDDDDDRSESDAHSTDRESSGSETRFPGFQNISKLGSSFRRLRTQSFPAIPWSSSPLKSTVVRNRKPSRSGSRARSRGTESPLIKPNDSSSSEDEDELRVVEAATSRGAYSGGLSRRAVEEEAAEHEEAQLDAEL